MGAVVLINAGLALAVEIALLAAAFRGGWILVPASQAAPPPASVRRLPLPGLVALKAALFAGGTGILFVTGQAGSGYGFAAAAALSLVLGIVVALSTES